MNQIPTPEQAEELVCRLICALVNHPDEVRLERAEFTRDTRWSVHLHVDDAGKVIGKEAAHVRSISLLLGLIGLRSKWRYSLRVLNSSDVGSAPQHRERPEPPDKYDPTAAKALLLDVLGAILEEHPEVDLTSKAVHPLNRKNPSSPKVEFTFAVRAAGAQDHDTLGEAFGPDEEHRMSAEAALGTLWRAIGKKDGVSFIVAVR